MKDTKGIKDLKSKALRLLTGESPDYASEAFWYDTGCSPDPAKTDVFYVLSTTLIHAEDENGKTVFNSTLSTEDRALMADEYEFMQKEMFGGGQFNFIAPYYRQMTFEAYEDPTQMQKIKAISTAAADVTAAFDYYMQNINGGRPFIVAGFSQGGMLTTNLLKHMTAEQFSRLIAAYSIGFQVTEKDLENPQVIPADGEEDLGVIVSFNSVASTDTIWEQIEGEGACCINPLNWKTDGTPAELCINGDRATVHIDEKYQVLVVEGLDTEKYDGQGYPIEKGVYHMWDPHFYTAEINKNAALRAALYRLSHGEEL